MIDTIIKDAAQHWVGDGFHVKNLISYSRNSNISPFLLLDYASPTYFSPTNVPRGVDFHPHRGFETVTIVYAGELEHGDNAGNSGVIRAGDVQWMTAARGILHEEKHSQAFSATGGQMEIVQLWVNLPAQFKMSEPHYQALDASTIPEVVISNGLIRVIAGQFGITSGIAKTFTAIDLFDIRLQAHANLTLNVADNFNALCLVLDGSVEIEGKTILSSELVIFKPNTTSVTFNVKANAKLLWMSGAPIHEPVVGAGPFVMNSQDEILQAYHDVRAGLF